MSGGKVTAFAESGEKMETGDKALVLVEKTQERTQF